MGSYLRDAVLQTGCDSSVKTAFGKEPYHEFPVGIVIQKLGFEEIPLPAAGTLPYKETPVACLCGKGRVL